jgi:GNAT superfamily N-acetyltransferase
VRPGAPAALDIVPVTPDQWSNVCSLFCSDPVTGTCWCMWPRHEPRSFRPGEDHRAEMQEIVLAGRVPGLLARLDERPVGWCASGRRREFPQYGASDVDDSAWAIPCVYVIPDCRGMGVSGALLSGAVAYAAQRGASIVHGPPPWWQAGSAAAVAATVAAFVATGFRTCGEGARFPLLELAVPRDR